MPERSPRTSPRRPQPVRSGARPGAAPGARPQRPLAQNRRPIGSNGSYGGRGGGFSTWSTRRKLRLLRTLAIALVLVIVLWQCTGDDTTEVSTQKPKITTTAVTTTIAPQPATTATATLLPGKLPAVHSLAGGAAGGDRVLMAGGLDAKKNSTDVVWSFDPASGATTALGKLPAALHTPAVAALGSGTLVMGGAKGNTVFDRVLSIDGAGTVTELGKLPSPRTNAAALSEGDGANVLVFGGWTGKDPTNDVLQTTDGATFTTVATLLHPTRYPAVALLGRSVWVIGGEYDKTVLNGIQRVDLDSGQVVDVAPLPVGLSRASAFSLGNAILVAGGRTPDGRSNQIYRVDPITGAVTAAGTLPEERSDSTVAVSGTTAYLFGGLTPTPTDSIVAITAA